MLKPPALPRAVPPATATAPTVSAAPTAPTEVQPPRPPWLRRLQLALQRAEQRILENFRVPPGGG
ncbi:hypothetical protein [Comamonas aquatica]|jgi:hypothetical protein|uniref:hypothetical protein n=1 Tax=Comamonas aquatica TaxID=225991 RepID=UPI00244AB557|nr:hypothetical protein [Comamonas aquatica]MDH0383286.1 hypothetical protein [Comamonas aquatica]MDH0431291.1 hypothetical protein [Comamonas aquatica]MDH0899102.1 hypothetical protein [Comamonas aquatica]MDH0942388.1 hypothetical protein [Comamonas aquatica]